jgi:Do/DeqQ family serine protease
MKRKKTITIIKVALIVAFVTLIKLPTQAQTTTVNPIRTGPDFTTAAETSIHAVVHIKTEFARKSSVYDDFFGFGNPFSFFNPQENNYPLVATGSGVIVESDGYIITNNHVVQDANVITVTLNDKREFTAELIGTDPSSDLALIKINATNLPKLVYGNSDQVKVGEWVLAVGNPFNLTSTVTAGIISAKARNLNILGSNSNVESFLQTDAAVNPGNSGGALVNVNGELIGINAAIASNTGSYSGYSFAIPANIVKKVAEDLKKYGEVQRSFLGASFSEINSKLASDLNLKEIKGIYVNTVDPNGAAAESEIMKGDIILAINETETNSYSILKEFLGQHRPGDKVTLKLLRNNSEITKTLTLRNKNGNTSILKKEEQNIAQMTGALLTPIDNRTKQLLRINNGLKVERLDNGLFKNAGIQVGFIVVSIDRKAIYKTEDIDNYLKNKKGGFTIEGYYPNGMKVIYAIGI